MSVSSSSPYASAISSLEEHEVRLVAELSTVRSALTAVRSLLGISAPSTSVPVSRPVRRGARSSVPSERRRPEAPTDEAVRDLLKRGPATVALFRRTFNLQPFKAREAMRDLEARGVVVVNGVKSARRVRLPGAAAKEAP